MSEDPFHTKNQSSSIDFKHLFNSLPGLYLILDTDFTIVAVSNAYLKATMTERDNIVGRPLFEVFPDNPADPAATGTSNLRASLNRVLKHSALDAMAVQKYDIRRPESEGGGFEERYWSPVNTPLLGTNGKVAYIIHEVQDVTEFVRIKNKGFSDLHEAKSQLEAILEQSHAIVCLKDPQGKYVLVNSMFEKIFNITRAEIFGKTDSDIFPQEIAAKFRETDLKVLTTKKPLKYEETIQFNNQTLVYISHKFPLYHMSGALYAVCTLLLDITDRKQMENALKMSQASFASIVEKNTAGILIVDSEDIVRFANPAALKQLRYMKETILNKPFQIAAPLGRQEIEILCEDGKVGQGNFWIIPTEWEGKSASLITIHDISKVKELESQLRQSQKMEAVGRLAGGIAHDFNNHLAVIKMTVELVIDSLDEKNASLKDDLEEIKRAGDRASTLTRQLLAFSRQQLLQPTILNLNSIVSEMDRMLRRLIGEDIELETRLCADLGTILADHGQIEQVVMNLVVNARDAMPNGGRLTIETSNSDLDEAYTHHHYVVRPGAYVMLAISDTGEGMDAETQEKIFEPFFTTKEKGKGTGLGLSTVYGIVKQSNGYVWVYSEPGRGTAFKIYLPRSDAISVPAAALVPRAKPMTSHETILVAEDEESVRKLICRVLNEYGYTILEAKSGIEAIEIIKNYAGVIHILVTDIVMPSMSGRELAAQASHIRPDMKVLYLSGYTPHAIVQNGVLDSETAFLQKPFSRDALTSKIRQVLGQ